MTARDLRPVAAVLAIALALTPVVGCTRSDAETIHEAPEASALSSAPVPGGSQYRPPTPLPTLSAEDWDPLVLDILSEAEAAYVLPYDEFLEDDRLPQAMSNPDSLLTDDFINEWFGDDTQREQLVSKGLDLLEQAPSSRSDAVAYIRLYMTRLDLIPQKLRMAAIAHVNGKTDIEATLLADIEQIHGRAIADRALIEGLLGSNGE